eukprot:scaffold4123_cov145-Skeletonema_menzelii.AAC.9
MAMLRPTKRAAVVSSGAARSSLLPDNNSDKNDHENEDRRALLHQKANNTTIHRHGTQQHAQQPSTPKRICKSICLLFTLLLISFPLLMKLDRANPAGLRVQKSIAEHNNRDESHKIRRNITNHCEVYDEPPGAVVFLHGHGAKAWHTSCDALFARTIAYYRDLAKAFDEAKMNNKNEKEKIGNTQDESNDVGASLVNSTQKRLSNHMMTLTSNAQGTKNYVHKWFGRSAWKVQLQLDTPEAPISAAPYYLPSHYSPAYYQSENKPCRDLLDKWKDVIPSHTTHNPYMSTSCCASFIVPGHRIHRYPRELYQDLFDLLTNPTNDDLVVGRFCFEYLVYDLFHDDGLFEFEDVVKLYDEADALIHGKRGMSDRVEKDESVVGRLGNCLAS